MSDEAVLDAVDVELGAEEIESGADEVIEGAEPVEAGKTESDSPYTTKASREMRAALKAWEAANPESAKYAKQARDNHARLFALSQLEPKGIEGVRENYALLNGLIHGEAKGPEALRAIQEEMAGVANVDSQILAGNKEALNSFGPEFDEGFAKLAPAILDRILQTNPQAYEAAIMPRVASTLKSSDLIQNYNRGIDELSWILADRPISQLNPQEQQRFMQRAFALLAQTSEGFNKFAQHAKADGPQNASTPAAANDTLEQERQKFHWDSKISPGATAHENSTFNMLFEPYQRRLKLDSASKDDLLSAFKAGLSKAGTSDAEYMRQMKIYRGQKNPDPLTVTNFVKASISKHGKNVLESLVKTRYSAFLNGTKAKAAVTPGARPVTPAGPNEKVVSVKPAFGDINHRATPLEWSTPKKDGSRKYKMNDGSVVLYRPLN